jgi:glycosidase
MADFGYDISNYTAVHCEYGSMDDFENLSRRCTQYGVKLILDFIPNHTSNESIWLKKSELRDEFYKDFYVWHPGKVNETTGEREPPSNWVILFRYTAVVRNQTEISSRSVHHPAARPELPQSKHCEGNEERAHILIKQRRRRLPNRSDSISILDNK